MSDGISYIVSGISLIISIWAIFEAKKARDLNYRSIKSDKLDKYGKELYEIQNSTRNDLEKLSHNARVAYGNAGKYLDRYSGGVTGGRPARHILDDFCCGFWEQYINTIGNYDQPICWHHLGTFLELEKHPNVFKDDWKVLSAYKMLCVAIPESDRQATFDAVFECSENYQKFYLEIRQNFEDKIGEIDSLIGRNLHEEVKLQESEISRKLISEKNKYEELLSLGLDSVKLFVESPKDKPEGWQFHETLYILLTLYIVKEYDNWGGSSPN